MLKFIYIYIYIVNKINKKINFVRKFYLDLRNK